MFLFSDEVEYGCTACGQCCRERWRVPLDALTREGLGKRDWKGTLLEAKAKSDPEFFVQDAPTLSTGAAFRTSEGACTLLGEDGLCTAHRLYGPQAKGVVCRLFPYLFVEAPEGVYTGYSFCCRPVRHPAELAATGRAWEESVASVYDEAKGFSSSVHYQVAPKRVALTPTVEIPWDGYLQLETGLLYLLNRPERPLAFHLIAGHVYLTLAGLFLEEFRDQDEDSLRGKVAHYVERMRSENFGRVDRIAQRGRGRMGVRRYVLSVMLGLHESGMIARQKRDARGGPGMISRWNLFRGTIRHFFERRSKTMPSQEVFAPLVGRYFRHVIWRKGLALGRSLYRLGGLTREYAMLLIEYALLEYFAGKLAADRGDEEATSEAIRIVERDFVLHAGRDVVGPAEEDRDAFELFLGLFDSLVGSKAFAPSIVGLKSNQET